MPTITFNPALFKLVKQLTKLGQEAEAIGHALKDLGVTLASNDLGRMMAQFELSTKRDTNGHGNFADRWRSVRRKQRLTREPTGDQTMTNH